LRDRIEAIVEVECGLERRGLEEILRVIFKISNFIGRLFIGNCPPSRVSIKQNFVKGGSRFKPQHSKWVLDRKVF
jgi:hypothetical protein